MHFARYDESFRERTLREQGILDGMHKGVAEKQFQVYYQPKYNLVTGEMAGAEALVRWQHPEMGFLAPMEFIPLFEKNGFITELDMYVWETACRDLRGWLDAGYPNMTMSVNVSRADIYNPNLPDILLSMVYRHGLEPRRLHLEITETAYTEDSTQLIEVVTKLKNMGFLIEMDDFGTGYSSLNMLSGLPISYLKLDKGFVQREMADGNRESILSFVFGLAGRLRLPVVAEGVETAEQAQGLKNMRCGYAQGFYYARPMPKADFERYLANVRLEDAEKEWEET